MFDTSMNTFLVMTKQNVVVTALKESGRMTTINLYPKEKSLSLGSILIAKVSSVSANIQAAFLDLGNGQTGFYPLSEAAGVDLATKEKSRRIKPGDELLIQISKEAMKSKQAKTTSLLQFAGRFLVLTKGRLGVGVTSKIEDLKWKEEIKNKLMLYCTEEYGFVVRTNAYDVPASEIFKEAKELIAIYDEVQERAATRTCFSILYQPPSPWLSEILGLNIKRLKSILVDDQLLYEQISQYVSQNVLPLIPLLSFYQDSYPLEKLFAIETEIKKAIQPKVWLQSGGFLIIEPTEAFTSIDVNTGKFEGKKSLRETFKKINREAALEIYYQLRLRNLSGIIIVDFIGMTQEEDREELLHYFDTLLKQDPIKTVLVEMTKLELVEITRKKMRKPLSEQVALLKSN